MKKIVIILLLVSALFFTGCSLTENMDNTPTKKVEALLNKYQMLDIDVLNDLDNVVDKQIDFSNKQRDEYKDIIKRNYQKLTYTIKDELVDGDTAEVETEIEVIDHTKIVSEANAYLRDNPNEFLTDNKYDNNLFIDYKLKKLKETKEKVKYTLVFKLTKVEDEWKIDSLTEEMRDKINGIY